MAQETRIIRVMPETRAIPEIRVMPEIPETRTIQATTTIIFAPSAAATENVRCVREDCYGTMARTAKAVTAHGSANTAMARAIPRNSPKTPVISAMAEAIAKNAAVTECIGIRILKGDS